MVSMNVAATSLFFGPLKNGYSDTFCEGNQEVFSLPAVESVQKDIASKAD